MIHSNHKKTSHIYLKIEMLNLQTWASQESSKLIVFVNALLYIE